MSAEPRLMKAGRRMIIGKAKVSFIVYKKCAQIDWLY